MDTIPNSPSNFSVNAISSTRLFLSWDASANTEIYKIYRLEEIIDDFVLIAETSNTSYDDYPLSPGTTYTYQITACNHCGESDPTEAEGETLCEVADAPTGLVISEVGDTFAILEWNTLASEPFIVYIIYYGTSPFSLSPFPLGTTSPGVNTFTCTGLNPSTTYYFQIFAQLECGVSDGSDVVATTTTCTLPGQISNLTATATSISTIELEWTDASNATSYLIQRRIPPSTTWGTVESGVLENSYSDTGLISSTQYCYRIRAVNSCGNGDFSEPEICTTTLSQSSSSCTPPSSVVLSANLAGTDVNLTWTFPTGSDDSYEIQRSDNSSDWVALATISTDTNSYLDTDAEEGHVYCYRIRVVGCSDTSDWSNTACIIGTSSSSMSSCLATCSSCCNQYLISLNDGEGNITTFDCAKNGCDWISSDNISGIYQREDGTWQIIADMGTCVMTFNTGCQGQCPPTDLISWTPVNNGCSDVEYELSSIVSNCLSNSSSSSSTAIDCNYSENAAGGDEGFTGIYDISPTFVVNISSSSSTLGYRNFCFFYETYSIKDRFVVRRHSASGELLHDSGCVGTDGEDSFRVLLTPDDNPLYIRMEPNCTGATTGTAWYWRMQCECPWGCTVETFTPDTCPALIGGIGSFGWTIDGTGSILDGKAFRLNQLTGNISPIWKDTGADNEIIYLYCENSIWHLKLENTVTGDILEYIASQTGQSPPTGASSWTLFQNDFGGTPVIVFESCYCQFDCDDLEIEIETTNVCQNDGSPIPNPLTITRFAQCQWVYADSNLAVNIFKDNTVDPNCQWKVSIEAAKCSDLSPYEYTGLLYTSSPVGIYEEIAQTEVNGITSVEITEGTNCTPVSYSSSSSGYSCRVYAGNGISNRSKLKVDWKYTGATGAADVEHFRTGVAQLEIITHSPTQVQWRAYRYFNNVSTPSNRGYYINLSYNSFFGQWTFTIVSETGTLFTLTSSTGLGTNPTTFSTANGDFCFKIVDNPCISSSSSSA